MERLTKAELVNGFPVCYPNNCSGLPEFVTKGNPYRNIVERLKAYEDLEEQGKLLKLPCAVGDTVYALDRFCSGSSLDCPSRPCESCEDYQLEIYEGEFKLNDINDFGKTVFLTREEAEEALKRMEDEK